MANRQQQPMFGTSTKKFSIGNIVGKPQPNITTYDDFNNLFGTIANSVEDINKIKQSEYVTQDTKKLNSAKTNYHNNFINAGENLEKQHQAYITFMNETESILQESKADEENKVKLTSTINANRDNLLNKHATIKKSYLADKHLDSLANRQAGLGIINSKKEYTDEIEIGKLHGISANRTASNLISNHLHIVQASFRDNDLSLTQIRQARDDLQNLSNYDDKLVNKEYFINANNSLAEIEKSIIEDRIGIIKLKINNFGYEDEKVLEQELDELGVTQETKKFYMDNNRYIHKNRVLQNNIKIATSLLSIDDKEVFYEKIKKVKLSENVKNVIFKLREINDFNENVSKKEEEINKNERKKEKIAHSLISNLDVKDINKINSSIDNLTHLSKEERNFLKYKAKTLREDKDLSESMDRVEAIIKDTTKPLEIAVQEIDNLSVAEPIKSYLRNKATKIRKDGEQKKIVTALVHDPKKPIQAVKDALDKWEAPQEIKDYYLTQAEGVRATSNNELMKEVKKKAKIALKNLNNEIKYRGHHTYSIDKYKKLLMLTDGYIDEDKYSKYVTGKTIEDTPEILNNVTLESFLPALQKTVKQQASFVANSYREAGNKMKMANIIRRYGASPQVISSYSVLLDTPEGRFRAISDYKALQKISPKTANLALGEKGALRAYIYNKAMNEKGEIPPDRLKEIDEAIKVAPKQTLSSDDFDMFKRTFSDYKGININIMLNRFKTMMALNQDTNEHLEELKKWADEGMVSPDIDMSGYPIPLSEEKKEFLQEGLEYMKENDPTVEGFIYSSLNDSVYIKYKDNRFGNDIGLNPKALSAMFEKAFAFKYNSKEKKYRVDPTLKGGNE